jgi:hypothetical protein
MSSRFGGRRAALAGLFGALTVILWLALATVALAGPAAHTRVPALDLSGFNHACGTAIDSKGNTYVSSAGESKVRIFSTGHVELTSIADANEPCGLAVDANGNLYVSEKTTGEVVKCSPSAYPPTGTTTYACATIDGSGNARGISVDSSDNRLYVAEGNRISTYGPEGKLGIDEVQRIRCFEASGGTYKLIFGGQETQPIACEAVAAVVKQALEELSTVGAGNVAVEKDGKEHLITFIGTLGHTDVGPLGGNASGLEPATGQVFIEEKVKGFSGHIGEGSLTDASGVAAYTNKVTGEQSDRYLFVADTATNQVKILSGADIRSLKVRRTLDGPKAGEDFGFGTAGAYLAVDPGNRDPATGKCASILEQACTSGHLLVYDDAHLKVDEFDATGELVDQLTDPAFADAEPTAMAVDRSGAANDGTIYVSAGAGPGATLLAFGPLATPDRPPLPELSHVLARAQAVATDSHGDVYVAAGAFIKVYGPDGKEFILYPDSEGKSTGIPVSQFPAYDLAVDSTGKVYTLVNFNKGIRAEEKVQYYTPSSYPPKDGTTYKGPAEAANGNSFVDHSTPLTRIGINPANDHVFAINQTQAIELGSATEGSTILNPCFACGLGSGGQLNDIAAYGANGNVYVSGGLGVIDVFNASGTELVARIGGGGSPQGPFSGTPGRTIAVDQSNGHVLVFKPEARQVAEEYDASGGFVAQFGDFPNGSELPGIAIDNGAQSPNQGNVYMADEEPTPGTPDAWAFGPLTYGEAPLAVTGGADGVGATAATLHGTVDPRGFELSECEFEYLPAGAYEHNQEEGDPPFAGASSQACAESLATIGHGSGAVSVHADLSGLVPEARYRFRLMARNKYGIGEGKAAVFGPSLATTEPALPVLRSEATLRASIDPSGLHTTYRFQYGTVAGEYDQSTPPAELAPSDGPVAVQATVTGLFPGTEYHYRVLAENEAAVDPVLGSDQSFETLELAESPPCPNAEYRNGPSAELPDCRAYELVTPADTRGATPIAHDPETPGRIFNNWLSPPRGALAGERVSYFIPGTLPGFEGNGRLDGYRAERAPGEHPGAGWSNALFSPTYNQSGGGGSAPNGVAADQDYSFWRVSNPGAPGEGLATGIYLRTPSGFEPLAQGSLAPNVDPQAEGRFLSPGGTHVIFSSKAHLEEAAAPQGTEAIYDRAAGASSAEVISVRPDGSAFGAGEDANYVGASEDGAAIAFRVAGTLYLHSQGQTTAVATAPNSFAGIAEGGTRIFYTDSSAQDSHINPLPAGLFACDVQAGPCVGAEHPGRLAIAPDSLFVNVSTDGSRVLFTSEEDLDGGGEGVEDEDNLYLWDGAETDFVARLDPEDLESFGGEEATNLRRWTTALSPGPIIGRATSPTRSTPDGAVFIFQSHARLTAYDNGGHSEIYRYDPAAAAGGRILCISCDPGGAPPSGEAALQTVTVAGGVTQQHTMIANLTDDGGRAVFESPDRLLPEDSNEALDVYEWKASGVGGCERASGCLALISSGQGEDPSFLYGMSADPEAHDIFFETRLKLLSTDLSGSPSLYDARVEGGIPVPPEAEPCHGDACQGVGSAPPALASPASTGSRDGNVPPEGACPKGKHRVKGRCVARHAKKHHRKAPHKHKRSQRRTDGNRRTSR